jgi:phospholysine phosphohistidine inorganic pyrophosphate phosphatase
MAVSLSGIRAVLIDISGVLYDGQKPIPGSLEALQKVRDSGIKYMLCTNETQYTRRNIADRLSKVGFAVTEDMVHCPAPACVQYLKEHGLRPHLLVHPQSLGDYDGVDCSNPNSVVLGDAAEGFSYENLNKAFLVLERDKEASLIALGMGRYYEEAGSLNLDVGPFAKALEFATGKTATIIGKPSPDYFKAALTKLGVSAEESVMIGDDVISDVGGAMNCGMKGILVRTGKFR